MADAPSRRMSIPLLLNPRMAQRVAGLLFSSLSVCVGVITKMEGHRGQVCGRGGEQGNSLNCTRFGGIGICVG